MTDRWPELLDAGDFSDYHHCRECSTGVEPCSVHAPEAHAAFTAWITTTERRDTLARQIARAWQWAAAGTTPARAGFGAGLDLNLGCNNDFPL